MASYSNAFLAGSANFSNVFLARLPSCAANVASLCAKISALAWPSFLRHSSDSSQRFATPCATGFAAVSANAKGLCKKAVQTVATAFPSAHATLSLS